MHSIIIWNNITTNEDNIFIVGFDNIPIIKQKITDEDYKKIQECLRDALENERKSIRAEMKAECLAVLKKYDCPERPENLLMTEDSINKNLKYAGRYNYNKAIDDSLLSISQIII